jgi:hypothetical protein
LLNPLCERKVIILFSPLNAHKVRNQIELAIVPRVGKSGDVQELISEPKSHSPQV